MTMMMMDANDDDEGRGCKRLPVHALRSGYAVSSANAGVTYCRWPGRAPAGALAKFVRRGSHRAKLNYEELSFAPVRLGCLRLLLTRRES